MFCHRSYFYYLLLTKLIIAHSVAVEIMNEAEVVNDGEANLALAANVAVVPKEFIGKVDEGEIFPLVAFMFSIIVRQI